jgi:predicted DNA-binding transcriptional regulator AlpA
VANTPTRFWFSGEVSAVTRIPESTLRYWEWADKAPEGFPAPIRLGRRVVYERAAIEKWLDAQIAAAQSGRGDKVEAGSP